MSITNNIDKRITNKFIVAWIAEQIKGAQLANAAELHSLCCDYFNDIEDVAGQAVREACAVICGDAHSNITQEELTVWVKTVIVELISE